MNQLKQRLDQLKQRQVLIPAAVAALALAGFGLYATWGPAAPTAPIDDTAVAPPASSYPRAAPTPPAGQPASVDTPRSQIPGEDHAKAPPEVLLTARFGNGPGQLGIEAPPPGAEGVTEGPSSFIPLPDGRIMVLDSLKQRIVWYDADGELLRTVDVPLALPADMVLGQDGSVFVFDRWKDRAIAVLDEHGQLKARFPVKDADAVGALYTAGEHVFVDDPGGFGRPVATLDGAPVPFGSTVDGMYMQDGRVPGRLSPDGSLVLSTGIDDRQAGRFFVSATNAAGGHAFSRQYTLDEPILGVRMLGMDRTGTGYLIYTPSDRGPDNRRSSTLLCIDTDNGIPLGKVPLPSGTTAVEAMRSLAVRDQGGVVHASGSQDGMSYELLDCRGLTP